MSPSVLPCCLGFGLGREEDERRCKELASRDGDGDEAPGFLQSSSIFEQVLLFCCIMAESIHLSGSLINQLVDDEAKSKKKTKKTKPKIARDTQRSQEKVHQKPIHSESEIQKGCPDAGWPPQMPFFLPPPTPPPSSSPELESIGAVLKETENVFEKLQRLEENMSKEVTERAKELHEKEFKLPQQKTILCQPEMSACLECYKEHAKDPLKCANVVGSFRECVHKTRKQVKLPS